MNCECGKKVFEYMDHTLNALVYKCAETGYLYSKGKDGKVVFIKGRAKPCEFYKEVKLGESLVHVKSMEIDKNITEDCKRIQELLASNTLDRNLLVWYVINRNVEEYVSDISNKVREIDLHILKKLRRYLIVLKKYPKFSLVYEIIDLIKRYTNVTEDELSNIMKGMMDKKNGVQSIINFYNWVTNICNHIEKNGFEFVEPVFGGVFNAPMNKQPVEPTISKKGFQYSNDLTIESDEEGDNLFESDEEDIKSEEDSNEEEEMDISGSDSELDENNSESGSEEEEEEEEIEMEFETIKKLKK